MERPKRKTNRLKGYDYSQTGGYFITICVKNKENILWSNIGGSLSNEKSILSDIGSLVNMAIKNIPHIYDGVSVDKYVIMPNHVHLILILPGKVTKGTTSPSISTIIGQLKRYVTRQVGYPIWQKLFYDRVIRNEMDYKSYWQYIDENPLKWKDDEYYCRGAYNGSPMKVSVKNMQEGRDG